MQITPPPPLLQSLQSIKQKMKLITYTNFQPPYFHHSLSKFRQTHLNIFLKDIKLDGENIQEIREKMKIVGIVIQKFDDQFFDLYASQLVEPYVRKMFETNYQFDAIQFKDVSERFNLQAEIHETLIQAAEWLAQVEVTQDLLSRIQLYYKLKTPKIIEKVREEGLQSEQSSWTGSFLSGVSKLISFGLRKGSKVVQTTFFTAVAPGALMLTLALMGGSISFPWKKTMNINSMVSAAAIVAVPYILDTMADSVQRTDHKARLKRWALTFESLAENIGQFNQKLEECVRECAFSQNVDEFLKARTNLEKIVNDLNKGVQMVTKFDSDKLEMMKERTQAYYKEYIEIKEDGWILVMPKDMELSHTHLLEKGTEVEMSVKVDQKWTNSNEKPQQSNNLTAETQNKTETSLKIQTQKENQKEDQQFVKL